MPFVCAFARLSLPRPALSRPVLPWLVLPCLALLWLAVAADASAQSVLERHVREEGRSFDTISRTAEAVTGPIAIQGNKLIFDGRKTVRLSPVGARSGRWSDPGRRQSADVFRLSGDPGRLRNGATLCSGSVRYVAFYEAGGIMPSLQAAFFASPRPPRGIGSQGLCAAFAYAID